jgi:antitoxin (DNA-binding transcriptional repressor) of toxin-antitoxin stability system
MKVFNYSEARQNFSNLLNTALKEEVVVKRRDGSRFKIVPITENVTKSPFDVPGIEASISSSEILDIIREGRERE